MSLIPQPQRSTNPRRQRIAVAKSLPAPVGGWNARDSVADMDPTEALVMENVWPTPADVMLRKGQDEHVTGIGAQVESLMAYNSPTARELFAAAGTAFYDVTTAGAVGAADVTGLTNARWQHTNIATSGGNFLLAVNGLDKLRGYNGTAWWTDGDGTHDITGVDTATIIHIHLFKTRIWLIQKETLKVWYLPVNSIAGGASSINFQSIAKRGGYVMAMGTWTLDAGDGMDDFAVFVTSEGEVIVYKGTDPSSANTWVLAGVWQLGAPIGRRCIIKYGGDCAVITNAGVIPLSRALVGGRIKPEVALTDKILDAMSEASRLYGTNYGWQLQLFPKASMLILNVPVQEGSKQQQYVMNTITGAWAKFKGLSANCWEVHEDKAYFGGNGTVYEFWEDQNDNDSAITGDIQQAFSYLGYRGTRKRILQGRPILFTNGSPTASFGVNADYASGDPTGTLSFNETTYAKWGVAKWGVGLWGTTGYAKADWQAVNGVGTCFAPRLKVQAKNLDVRWKATDLAFELGGIV